MVWLTLHIALPPSHLPGFAALSRRHAAKAQLCGRRRRALPLEGAHPGGLRVPLSPASLISLTLLMRRRRALDLWACLHLLQEQKQCLPQWSGCWATSAALEPPPQAHTLTRLTDLQARVDAKVVLHCAIRLGAPPRRRAGGHVCEELLWGCVRVGLWDGGWGGGGGAWQDGAKVLRATRSNAAPKHPSQPSVSTIQCPTNLVPPPPRTHLVVQRLAGLVPWPRRRNLPAAAEAIPRCVPRVDSPAHQPMTTSGPHAPEAPDQQLIVPQDLLLLPPHPALKARAGGGIGLQ